MNEDKETTAKAGEFAPVLAGTATAAPVGSRFFHDADWVSFWVATILALAAYLWTLAPNVTLEFSGIFSVGAMDAGVPHPPGYPLWTIYAWLFTQLLPFSNIAGRVAGSSAFAAALACGMIALMLSRSGGLMLEGLRDFKRLAPQEESRLRVVGGAVAGLGFAFDNGFWRKAVIVDPWPLSILMFMFTLTLLLR